MMMLGKKHVGCGGMWRVARGITELDEAHANEHEDAAILQCDKCKLVMTDDSTSSRPDRYRKPRVPDQSVFEVNVKNNTNVPLNVQVTVSGEVKQ